MVEIPRAVARDIMKSDVVSLSPNAPMSEAVSTLAEYRIHGAPVVDAAGALVGVLSLSDVVRRDRDLDEQENKEERGWPTLAFDREFVRDWMTSEVETVDPDTEVLNLCQQMSKDQIHRVFVVESRRLIGVVSALDVVDHIARPQPQRQR